MKRSAKACSACSTRNISFVSMANTLVGVTAVAVAMRKGCPAKPPSPRKSPGPKIATTASFPEEETTDSFTPPFWMYMTLLEVSPWEKTVAFLLNSTIARATPAESRKACTLKTGCFLVAELTGDDFERVVFFMISTCTQPWHFAGGAFLH